ncbi:hypothetical protein [Bartonella gliris]|uniref:hypothetical protein n=1 Tax=Bartonella gliris TaxID=3004109 RepID=UPI00295E9F1E|nr:hypothetical protein [Bartonella gliris]
MTQIPPMTVDFSVLLTALLACYPYYKTVSNIKAVRETPIAETTANQYEMQKTQTFLTPSTVHKEFTASPMGTAPRDTPNLHRELPSPPLPKGRAPNLHEIHLAYRKYPQHPQGSHSTSTKCTQPS